MTALPLAPVIPSSAVPRGQRRGRPTVARPLPLGRPVRPAPEGVVYGLGRIDSSGRICGQAVVAALGWADGELRVTHAKIAHGRWRVKRADAGTAAMRAEVAPIEAARTAPERADLYQSTRDVGNKELRAGSYFGENLGSAGGLHPCQLTSRDAHHCQEGRVPVGAVELRELRVCAERERG